MLGIQKLPSVEELRALFEEKVPGVLYYKARGSTRVPVGGIAGNMSGGYCTIIIKGYKYLRHRLIWKMHKGVDPIGVIDHINGLGDDSIDNLRDITESENCRPGEHFIALTLYNTKMGLTYALRFHIDLWADEEGEVLQQELEALIAPVIRRIIANRVGRKRVR